MTIDEIKKDIIELTILEEKIYVLNLEMIIEDKQKSSKMDKLEKKRETINSKYISIFEAEEDFEYESVYNADDLVDFLKVTIILLNKCKS